MTTDPKATLAAEELKSCPFCGENRILIEPIPMTRNFWEARCSGCMASVSDDGKEDAVTAWNTRVLDRASIEQIVRRAVELARTREPGNYPYDRSIAEIIGQIRKEFI